MINLVARELRSRLAHFRLTWSLVTRSLDCELVDSSSCLFLVAGACGGAAEASLSLASDGVDWWRDRRMLRRRIGLGSELARLTGEVTEDI